MTPAKHKRWLSNRVLFLYVIGFCLLAIVWLSPHAGCWEGKSFFNVAQASPWDRWWDWPAAWCSLKIILLSVGTFSFLVACRLLLKMWNQETLGKVLLGLIAVPSLGFWLGVYYLVKALL
jgi:hypothetical protein